MNTLALPSSSLIDDFVGSCTTLLRKKEDGKWTGKLFRFWDDNKDRFKTYFEDDLGSVCSSLSCH